jgi:phosphoenolpyruvate---glycerone phosphotransferase subunit DhaL
MLTKNQIIAWLSNIAQVLHQNKEYLTDLDSAIGDADHGINMDRGFQSVLLKMPEWQAADIGGVLKSVGMALMSSVGGASGPLYGTFFMRAGIAVASKQELNNDDLLKMLAAGVEGIRQRGRPELGDKTMYDALAPALDALGSSLGNGADAITAVDRAVQAAEAGMQATIPMQARKGRASYLGERSIGHQDPGATSSYMIIKALLDAIST